MCVAWCSPGVLHATMLDGIMAAGNRCIVHSELTSGWHPLPLQVPAARKPRHSEATSSHGGMPCVVNAALQLSHEQQVQLCTFTREETHIPSHTTTHKHKHPVLLAEPPDNTHCVTLQKGCLYISRSVCMKHSAAVLPQSAQQLQATTPGPVGDYHTATTPGTYA